MWTFLTLILLLIINSDAKSWKRPQNTGVSCEWQGVKGTCVNFWNCVTNAIDATYDIHPPICSREGNEVIACCTGCDLTTNISSIVIFQGHMIEKTGKKSIDTCLDYKKRYQYQYECFAKRHGSGYVNKTYLPDDRCFGINIAGVLGVGGQNARRAEYPHMALLGYGEDLESAQWLCGGSIISESYILTAAHCGASNILGAVGYAAVGILKRSDPRELWQVYRSDSFIPHPDYTPPSTYHDIGLLKTDIRINFKWPVLPACLPQGDEYVGQAHATGWGSIGLKGRVADVLQKIPVKKFTARQCLNHYPPHRRLPFGYSHNTQLCYGDEEGRDTCEGDSGGPLQLDHECPHVIIGVTSSGHPCGFPGSPGLYTRVQHYVNWIENIVWP